MNDLIQDYIPSRHSNADVYPPPPIEALPPLPERYARQRGPRRQVLASGLFRFSTASDAAVSTYPPTPNGRPRSASSAGLSARPSTMFSVMNSSMLRPLKPRPAMSADVAAVIRPGFAFAQLLPGKTLRLTLRTPNKMSWKPGQWVYLTSPAFASGSRILSPSRLRMTPTFPSPLNSSTQTRRRAWLMPQKQRAKSAPWSCSSDVRHGFTRHLWNFVAKKRQLQIQAAADAQQGASMYGPPGTAMVPALGKDTTGVHIRAIVDGPYGSADRTHWGIHSSIVIICGGSGVSFGMSVLEHLCACMVGAMAFGKGGKGGKKFLTQRVRFVWIVRELFTSAMGRGRAEEMHRDGTSRASTSRLVRDTFQPPFGIARATPRRICWRTKPRLQHIQVRIRRIHHQRLPSRMRARHTPMPLASPKVPSRRSTTSQRST